MSLKGKVVEIYGNKFVLQDGSGRALIETGRAGEDGDLVKANEEITVEGRFEHGFLHARSLTHADGKVATLRLPPPPHGPRPGGPGPDGRGPDGWGPEARGPAPADCGPAGPRPGAVRGPDQAGLQPPPPVDGSARPAGAPPAPPAAPPAAEPAAPAPAGAAATAP